MGNTPPRKRQRLDRAAGNGGNGAEQSPESGITPPCLEGELPAELWLNVLSYLYFDEVQKCTAVSKCFLNDVTRQMKKLLVRTGKSMDIAPAAIERFSSVEDVDIYLIEEMDTETDSWHLDCVALKTAVPFLSKLPKLSFCFIGGEEVHPYDEDDKATYDVNNGYDVQNSNQKFAELIQSVCKAYKTGKLTNVVFHGLFPFYPFWPVDCVWREMKIGHYRNDVRCQLCDMMATSFPPLCVLNFDHDETPCIRFENRVKIIRHQYEQYEENGFHSILTTALRNRMKNRSWICVALPPDFMTSGSCMRISNFHYIQCLVANGANPNDSAIHSVLMDTIRGSVVGGKTIIEMKTFNELRALGFDISEEDCLVVDESDRRTDYTPLRIRKAKEHLNSGVKLSCIKEIREKVEDIVAYAYPGDDTDEEATIEVKEVQKMLEKWLRTDLSDHKEALRSLVVECAANWQMQII